MDFAQHDLYECPPILASCLIAVATIQPMKAILTALVNASDRPSWRVSQVEADNDGIAILNEGFWPKPAHTSRPGRSAMLHLARK